MMRFAYLGSGSKGNSAVIEADGTRVLLDCGFGLRDAEMRLQRLDLSAADLDAILVTHEHDDHLGGVARLARRHQIPVWLTGGTLAAWRDAPLELVRCISPHERFVIDDLQIQPYPVPHDAHEPCQYVFSDGARRVGVLSDAGSVTPHMREMLTACDALLIEFNHDAEMLQNGPYPESLKRRVGGSRGHLSNVQAAGLLSSIDCSRLRHLALAHLSTTNNTPQLALALAAEALGCTPDWLVCADQDAGLDWRQLS
ncbi:MAG: fold metallo-hydrolase [Nevskia sp.]|nr:fold metallo-hydrolase [Nevskia sp.]